MTSYDTEDFHGLLRVMEARLLTHNTQDFVSVGAENYVFIGRVLRMFDAAHQAVDARIEEPDANG